MDFEQCKICNIIENALWFCSKEQVVLTPQRMDLIYSQLGTLYEVFSHAYHSWTQQSYAPPVHFVMVLQNFIHILIG